MGSSAVTFDHVQLNFGKQTVFPDLNWELPARQIHALIGESGSGKTSCLRLINGLLKPRSGVVRVLGEPINYENGELLRRRIGYVVQGSGLFPHMTVLDNISVIGWRSGWSYGRRLARAVDLLKLVRLDAKETLLKRPSALSGGQRQRVALARALFMEPRLMLMDEPFGALDPRTREEMQDVLLSLQKEKGLTVVLVTHDLTEAFRLAHKIHFIYRGRVEQEGPPKDLLLNPKSPAVSEFLRSHSPAEVLERIKLYAVLNENIWTSRKTSAGYLVANLKTGETQRLTDGEAHRKFLAEKNQKLIYLVNENGRFAGVSETARAELQLLDHPVLAAEDSLLTGLKALLRSRGRVPVLNREGHLLGCLSEEAFHALS